MALIRVLVKGQATDFAFWVNVNHDRSFTAYHILFSIGYREGQMVRFPELNVTALIRIISRISMRMNNNTYVD